MSTSSRRQFLKTAGLLGGGLSALGFSLPPQKLLAGRHDLPYYKAGAPFSNDIAKGRGEPITLQGVVYKHDGKTPLSNAIVEVWHCNAQGQFDYSDQYVYRGKTRTDEHGRYLIKTHLPGRYKEKGHYKMSRLFVLVDGPGHQESFSELYLSRNGKPFIHSTQWAACPQAEMPALPKLAEAKTEKVITYNHYLNRLTLLDPLNPQEVAAGQFRIYSNHRTGQPYLHFGKSRPGSVAVKLINTKGQLVHRELFKDIQPGQPLPLNAAHLPSGKYSCSVYTAKVGGFTKVLHVV